MCSGPCMCGADDCESCRPTTFDINPEHYAECTCCGDLFDAERYVEPDEVVFCGEFCEDLETEAIA